MLYSVIPHVFPHVAEGETAFVEITCVISDSLSLLYTQTLTHTRTHFLGLTVYPPTHAIICCCLPDTHLVFTRLLTASQCRVSCGELTFDCGCRVWERQARQTSVMLLYNQHSCVGSGDEKTLEENDTGVQCSITSIQSHH